MQYGRREGSEVPNRNLEDEVVGILKEINVLVNRKPIKKVDEWLTTKYNIPSGKSKIFKQVIFDGRNLKGTKRYDDNNKTFLRPLGP